MMTVPLKDVLRQTGVSSQTLYKYVGMGLIPAPEIRYTGKGKEVYYDDDVVNRVYQIGLLKEKGYRLAQIREKFTCPEEYELVAAKPNPDKLSWAIDIFDKVQDERNIQIITGELDEIRENPDGTMLLRLKIVSVPKGVEATEKTDK